jgi:hypothetical protein
VAFLGWLVLSILTAAAALNAVALARWVSVRRTERGLVAAVAFFAYLAAPVLVLGYTDTLTAAHLGACAALLHAALFFILARGATPQAHLAACLRGAGELASMPRDAWVFARRARSFATLALSAAFFVIAYALVITVLVPVSSWDGAMYHEPIVGFALQNHGFSAVALPPHGTLQATNGYPRLCESLAIWFVIFTDRTLIELPNVLAAPALLLAVYALASRAGDKLLSMTCASALILMPQIWVQLCAECVDILVGFFAVTAVYFATRTPFRMRDALVTTLALGLLIGSKFSALTMTPIVAIVAAARLARGALRARPGATVATVLGSALFLTAVGAIQLIRNARAFHNPVWPVGYDNARLGIHWKGLGSMAEFVADVPLQDSLAAAYATPVPGLVDVIERGYGYAFAWVLVPLGVIALLCLSFAALTDLARRRGPSPLRDLGVLMLITAAFIVTTPTLSGRNARYNCHLLAGLIVALVWMLRRPAWLRAREAIIGATVVASLFPLTLIGNFAWAWGMTDDAWSIFRHPWSHHDFVAHPVFDLLSPSRAAEVHAGDRVAFDQDVIFIGALWNFDFSNSVRLVPSGDAKRFLATLRDYDPTWVAVGSDDARAALRSTHEWALVGDVSPGTGDQVFRRIRR